MTIVALYARVSSSKQVDSDTISSQVEAIKSRIDSDGMILLEENKFVDNGYSGSNLVRPALEKLRDQVALCKIDKIYIHSPDRLSRKYTYQMILIEEFEKLGVDMVFLNFQSDNNPESTLLLQMQGMIAEYERAKIMERHRRGRIHTAKRGSINALCVAPYGFRYIDKYTNNGEASFEMMEEQAEVVRKIFNWVGNKRLTIGKVARKLHEEGIKTKTGKSYWDRGTLYYMLKNPAYKGAAAFGRKKTGTRIPSIRPRKDSCEQPKDNSSRYAADEKDWIYIPVPAIIDEELFDLVQDQLEENKKRAREHQKGASYLLQGLLVCKQCARAYCGGKSRKKNIKIEDTIYRYYRCTGTDSTRFGGTKMCNNKQFGADAVETVIWEEVKKLLINPDRIFSEYEQRLKKSDQTPFDHTYASIDKQRKKLEKSIELLIDGYTQEYIVRSEFEPRITSMRNKLSTIKEQQEKLIEQNNLNKELELIVSNIEEFSDGVISKVDNLDWKDKRDLIRQLIKRIEIAENDINIVYRVPQLHNNLSDSGNMILNRNMQHCCNGTHGSVGRRGKMPL